MEWNGLITKLRNDDDYTQSHGRAIHVAPLAWTVTGRVLAADSGKARRVCCKDGSFHGCTTEPPCTGDPTVRQLAPGPVSLALHPNARIEGDVLHVGVHIAAIVDPGDPEANVFAWHERYGGNTAAVYHLYQIDKDQTLPSALEGLRGRLLAVAVAPT